MSDRRPANGRNASVAELMQNDDEIAAALQRGTRAVLRLHKAAGNSIPDWRDGAVRWISADEIDLQYPENAEP